MRSFATFLLLFVLASTGYKSPAKREKEKETAQAKKDANTIAAMMTTDFAFVMGSSAEADRKGEGVFQYWDEAGLWRELSGILSEKFVKKEEFMVAPPQFANPGITYDGYRAGIRRVNGSWKFAYFVNG
ncbi:MAG: hypothetical protein ABI883_02925 [Chthoniobacterales bacterium]